MRPKKAVFALLIALVIMVACSSKKNQPLLQARPGSDWDNNAIAQLKDNCMADAGQPENVCNCYANTVVASYDREQIEGAPEDDPQVRQVLEQILQGCM